MKKKVKRSFLPGGPLPFGASRGLKDGYEYEMEFPRRYS